MTEEVPNSGPEERAILTKMFLKDEDEDEWREDYVKYLSDEVLPEDCKTRNKILRTAW